MNRVKDLRNRSRMLPRTLCFQLIGTIRRRNGKSLICSRTALGLIFNSFLQLAHLKVKAFIIKGHGVENPKILTIYSIAEEADMRSTGDQSFLGRLRSLSVCKRRRKSNPAIEEVC